MSKKWQKHIKSLKLPNSPKVKTENIRPFNILINKKQNINLTDGDPFHLGSKGNSLGYKTELNFITNAIKSSCAENKSKN